MRTRALVILTVLLAAVAPSYGGVVQNWFAGTVTSAETWGSAPDLFEAGNPVWVLLTYDTTATPAGTSTSANYVYNPEGIYGLSITIGGFTFATQDGGGPFVLSVKNNDWEPLSTITDDVYAAGWRTQAVPGSPGLIYGTEIEESIHIIQQSQGSDPSLVAGVGAGLPFSLNLSSADFATGYIQSTDFINGYRVEFDINDQIPEPGSLPLMLAGAAVLAALRLRYR